MTLQDNDDIERFLRNVDQIGKLSAVCLQPIFTDDSDATLAL